MSKAYSYIRFSSKAQEMGDSVQRQDKGARDYAAKHGLVLDTSSYRDLGISAFKGKNATEGALGIFLEAVDQGKIEKGSYLLVESLDRVSRESVMDAFETFRAIIKRGINLVTIFDGQVYSRESIDQNWTMLIGALAVMQRAYEESATKSSRVKAAWEKKRASGENLTAMGPSWLKLNKEKERWELVPEKVKIVVDIFDLAVSGLGSPTITRRLTEQNVPMLGNPPLPRDGVAPKERYWSPALVNWILRNDAVIGTFTSKKVVSDPIENYYPAIIKKEIFYKVQEQINSKRKTGGPKGKQIANLFSGRLFCECGEKMKYVSSNKRMIYLQCGRSYSRAGCDGPTIPYTTLEESLLEFVVKYKNPLEKPEEILHNPRQVLMVEYDKKRVARDNLLAVAESGVSFAGGTDALARRLAILDQEVSTLRRALRAAPEPSSPRNNFKEAKELFLKHQKMQQDNDEGLYELREQLQASMRALIAKVVLRKKLDTITVREDDGVVKEVGQRECVIYGPYADLVLNSEEHYIYSYGDPPPKSDLRAKVTRDNGIVHTYALKPWGINGTRKRKS